MEVTITIHRIIILLTTSTVMILIGGTSKSLYHHLYFHSFIIITTVHVNSNICKKDTYDIHTSDTTRTYLRVYITYTPKKKKKKKKKKIITYKIKKNVS